MEPIIDADTKRDCDELIRQLSKIRRSSRLSQAAVADLCKTSRATISCVERGEAVPELVTMIKMAKALNYRLELVPIRDADDNGDPVAAYDLIGSLTKRRVALHMSQAELAARCDVSRSLIAGIETRAIVPKLTTVLKIAEALGGAVTFADGQEAENATECKV